MTLFAHHPGTLSAILLLPTAFICFLFPPHQSGTPLPSGGSTRGSPVSHRTSTSHHDEPSKQGAGSPEQTDATRLSALSTYRAHMMLVTVLAILAVDFPVFPRSLAKCETYGVSFVRIFPHACCLLWYLRASVDGHGRWVICIFPRNCFCDPSHTAR
jgi:phosphatidylinositol glycan class W